MSTKAVGSEKEQMACRFLQSRGALILEKNFRCRLGEIDVIGLHEGNLVFFEVKYRKNFAAGYPEEAVDQRKRAKICRVSDYYRLRNQKYENCQIRFDVIAILGEEITWYQNAFPYTAARGYSW